MLIDLLTFEILKRAQAYTTVLLHLESFSRYLFWYISLEIADL